MTKEKKRIGRPKKSDADRRTQHITVKYTPTEREALEAEALEADTKLRELIRKKSLEGTDV